MGSKNWAMFDLDGTLCNDERRHKFEVVEDWDAYHSDIINDPHYEDLWALAQAWLASGGQLVYNTARPDRYHGVTELWLQSHQLPIGPLLMRKAGDDRPSPEVKLGNLLLWDGVRCPTGDRLVFVIDDRADVIEAIRAHGYTCLQTRPRNSSALEASKPSLAGTSVPAALKELAELYLRRNKVYGDDFLRHGKIMMSLFPRGVTLKSAEDFCRFATMKDMVTKLGRYCNNFFAGGHEDSLNDLSVFAQMMRYQDKKEPQDG